MNRAAERASQQVPAAPAKTIVAVAHAHGVNPGAVLCGKSSSHGAVVNTQALSELVPVISAPQQLRNLSGKKK